MSTPRKKKPSRIGPQQTTKYSLTLDNSLHLITRTDAAAQENRFSKTRPGNALSGGRRSTDRFLLISITAGSLFHGVSRM